MTNSTEFSGLDVQLAVDHPTMAVIQLTELLAVLPDEHWNAGDAYTLAHSNRSRQHGFSRWSIHVVGSSLDDLPETVLKLTSRICDVEENFLRLPSEASVRLTLFVSDPRTVVGLGFGKSLIALLARIGAEIEVSLLVTHTSERSR